MKAGCAKRGKRDDEGCTEITKDRGRREGEDTKEFVRRRPFEWQREKQEITCSGVIKKKGTIELLQTVGTRGQGGGV